MSVENGRKAVLPFAVGLGRNVRHSACLFDLTANGVAVVALVSMQDFARRKSLEKRHSGCAISDLAAGQQEGERAAFGVGQGVDFGCASAAGSADGLIFLPPLPPEAERCAFTAEESTKTCAGGPPACASAWNSFDQTPFAAQRT